MNFNLPSPAKLNLFLHILGQRDDGYHNLQTVFQLLDFGDTISFSDDSQSDIALDFPDTTIRPEENLIYRAAKLLQAQVTKTLPGVRISVRKTLPMGGGIGGGSSNAATTLLGLNHHWNLKLSLDHLAQLGRQLGADVPVFVRGKSAWAEGIGEQLKPVELPSRWYLVLKPNCSISTQRIFSHKDLTRNTPAITLAAFLEVGGKNDCQPLVEKLYPEVKDAVAWLRQHGPTQLTGTGACIFAAFADEQSAQKAYAQRPEQLEGFVAQGVNTSPLHRRLQSLFYTTGT